MCGLCGIALHDQTRLVSREKLLAMAEVLKHRGPDDGGVHVGGPVGVAFRRLSIIDIDGGHQPLFNESGDIVLTMNGEIYNFLELRRQLEKRGHRFRTKSDAEVLVHLFEERGVDLVEDLIGMFAFAILDLREEVPVVVLARDRVGIKPLYYSETPEGLLWASEPKAILASGETGREFRAEALVDFLIQGYVGGENSAWAGIKRLLPGHTLVWRPTEGVSVRRYWDLPTAGLRDRADYGELLDRLDEVVSDRLVADVPLGAFLSGGVDSTAVVTSMSHSSSERIVACSVGFRERSHDELEVARETAGRLGLIHHTEILTADPTLAIETLPWYFDEPHGDPSTVPTFLVSKMARAHVKVALSGDGGDETFGGYRRYVHDLAENRLRKRVGTVGQSLSRFVGRHYPKADWAPRIFRARTFLTNVGDTPARAYWRSVTQLERGEVLEILNPDLRASLGDYDPFTAFETHYNRPRVDDSLYRAQYADFHTYLPGMILSKVDRASMAVSLEVRVPILDHRFCGRYVNLPSTEKIRDGRGKFAFRQALRSRVPSSLLDQKKRGFDVPLKSWIRGPLSGAVSEAIETLPEDWFQRRRLRQKLAEHQAGFCENSRLLWSLLVLEQWRRRHQVTGLSV